MYVPQLAYGDDLPPDTYRALQDPVLWYSMFYRDQPFYPDQLSWCLNCERMVDETIDRVPDRPREAAYVAARRAGKNESDARFSVRALCKYSVAGGQAVKTAPTYKPQIAVSMRRLRRALDAIPWLRGEWDKEFGYIYRVLDMALAFLSAGETANRVGEGADKWLAIDECQDTSSEVYSKDLSPMRGSTGAPTFFMGTAWLADCLLEEVRNRLREQQRKLGRQLLWEVPWHVRAEHNEEYGRFCEFERERLGETHPIWLSQYCLVALHALGRLIDNIDKLIGNHPRLEEPRVGRIYVGGVDYCGAGEEPDEAAFSLERARKRDSTVALIGELIWCWRMEQGVRRALPQIRLVDGMFRPGQPPESLTDDLYRFFFEKWGCLLVAADARGVGDGPSLMLQRRRPGQVERIQSTLTDVSRMGFRLMGAINSNRFKLWRDDGSPEWAELKTQFEQCRRRVLPSNQMRWGAPTKQVVINGVQTTVHDDGPRAGGYVLEAGYRHLASFQVRDDETELVPWDEAAGWEMQEAA